jgi:hypothetical protein
MEILVSKKRMFFFGEMDWVFTMVDEGDSICNRNKLHITKK